MKNQIRNKDAVIFSKSCGNTFEISKNENRFCWFKNINHGTKSLTPINSDVMEINSSSILTEMT